MREKLFFDVCREANVPLRGPAAEVLSTSWGFYTVVEQIDDQFLDWNILEDDSNLFKACDNWRRTSGAGQHHGRQPRLLRRGPGRPRGPLRTEIERGPQRLERPDFPARLHQQHRQCGLRHRHRLPHRSGRLPPLSRDGHAVQQPGHLHRSARNYYLYHNQDTNLEWIK